MKGNTDLDDERTTGSNSTRHRSQNQEPRIVPRRNNQSDTFGLFLDPRVVELETQGRISDARLVLHPFGEALHC